MNNTAAEFTAKRRVSMNNRFFLGTLVLLLSAGIAAIWNFRLDTLIEGFIGGLVGAFLTLLLAYVAWVQLGGLSKTASADFILRFKREFFQEPTRTLIHLIDSDWIEFAEGEKPEDSSFNISTGKIAQSGLPTEIKDRLTGRKTYSVYEVDDFLLGHLEDLGMLWQERILHIEMIHEMFSWYLETVWENCEIQKYVKTQPSGVYMNAKRLYEKCRRPDEEED